MGKVKDLRGQKFGRLTVIEPAPRPQNIKSTHCFWLCRCTCGEEKIVNGESLRNGSTTSCGCKQKERIREKNTKHGMKETKLYRTHASMKQRCYNPNHKNYKDYGGRGIKICDKWLDKENGFLNFYNWAMSHGYSDDLSIDRINVDRGYSPDNCRWANRSVQSNNRRIFKNNKNNKTGHIGVRVTPNGKYRAEISKNRKLHYLGTFATIEEAIEARKRAERELYPECMKKNRKM